MFKYTIAFIKRGDEILLLNRQKSQWMGCWNGVGGKIEAGETPLQCILREVKEETDIELTDASYRGCVTWNVGNPEEGGMYVFLAELPDDFDYPTPTKRIEGILDWKTMEWICHPENQGTANLHYFLENVVNDDRLFEYQFIYEGYHVKHFEIKKIVKHKVETLF